MQYSQQFVQPESNQFARNGDRNVPSSQQMDLEARYILNPEDRKYYIDMFKSLDADHDGYISREEAARYFSQSHLPKRVFDQLFLMCDCDKDGRLDISEFTCAGHIAYIHQSGVPLPREIPKCLKPENSKKDNIQEDDPLTLDFTEQNIDEKMDEDEQPALDISLNVDMIPTPREHSFFDDDEEEEEEVQPKSTNPFAQGLEEAEREAEEAERLRIKELEEASRVNPIVSDNRNNLQTLWKDNMQRWKTSDSRIQQQDDAIQEKKNQNADIREEIKKLQSQLGTFQDAIEAKVQTISYLQASLNNHLVKNKLDRPVRVIYDQPDITDLFTPPEEAENKTFGKKMVSTRDVLGSTSNVPYEAIENDPALSVAESKLDLFSQPPEEISLTGSPTRDRSIEPEEHEEPIEKAKPFLRSSKARSFFTSNVVKNEAIESESSEDEDLKPAVSSTYNAFGNKKKRDVNSVGTGRWYCGVYQEKKRIEDELEEERRREEEEKKREEEEERERKKREREERRNKHIEDLEREEYSDYSDVMSENEEKPEDIPLFVMTDSEDEAFSDDDLPMEKPIQQPEQEQPQPEQEQPQGEQEQPQGEQPQPEQEQPQGEQPEQEQPQPEQPPMDEEFIDDFAEEQQEQPQPEQEQPPMDEEFIDDFAEEPEPEPESEKPKGKKSPVEDEDFDEDLPSEKPKGKKSPVEEEDFDDEELPAEKPKSDEQQGEEDLPAEKPDEKKKKKDDKKKKDKSKPVEEKKERRGRRGKKEDEKKEGGGALGDLGPAKPKKKKKTAAKK